MGNACCLTNEGFYDKNIYIDLNSYSKRKNQMNTNKSNSISLNYLDKYKTEDNCSILINSFNKEINYIVSYKESPERKKFNQKNK